MSLINGVLIVIWFVAVPFFMGSLPVFRRGTGPVSFALNLVCGYALMFALFELIALPMIFGRLSFSVLQYTYGLLCLFLAVLGAVFFRGELLYGSRAWFRSLRSAPVVLWLAVALILFQMLAYVFGMATDLDDSFYVATATTTLETNEMFTYSAYTGRLAQGLPSRYVLAPFPILLAFFSSAVQMNAAAVAHTVEPVFFLLLSYIVYYFIGKQLFRDDRRGAAYFLFFLALVQTFSYYSVYTQGTFMLIRIWQGKAVLAALILPAIFYGTRCCMKEEASAGDWLRLLCLMAAATLVSGMGMMLAPVMVGILLVLYALPKRHWRKLLAGLACCLPNLCCAVVYVIIR